MKYIHFPTLAMHAGLLLLASLTLSDYPGTFLPLGILALIVHLVWAIRSRQILGFSHLIGSAAQVTVFTLGLIEYRTGGLSGAGFAVFFYAIALGISAAAEAVVLFCKCLHKR